MICDWNTPGQNPYTGKVETAIMSYQDIPLPVRQELVVKYKAGSVTEVVNIQKNNDVPGYYGLSQMHFGKGKICEQIDNSMWSSGRKEPGYVYCVQEHCIIIPTICNNVSRVFKPRSITPFTDITVDIQYSIKFMDIPDTLIYNKLLFEDPTQYSKVDWSVRPFDYSSNSYSYVRTTMEFPAFYSGLPAINAIGGTIPVNVSNVPVVAVVPEPKTYLMLLAGLAAMGLFINLRRKSPDA